MDDNIQNLEEKLKTAEGEEKVDLLAWIGYFYHNRDIEKAERKRASLSQKIKLSKRKSKNLSNIDGD